MAKFALGHHREVADAGCIRSVIAEFILTFLFIFAGVGSAMATSTCMISTLCQQSSIYIDRWNTYHARNVQQCTQASWATALTRWWA
jgi:glycerol uptake facilitator-like aquaporin